MRVARMGYSHRVTKKDSKGRITSSWMRVRKVVPPRLVASLPPPYTGRRTLMKKPECLICDLRKKCRYHQMTVPVNPVRPAVG